MGNLPFERTRYNPVRDVTSDEAERDKREQTTEEAEAKRRFEERRDADGPAGEDAAES